MTYRSINPFTEEVLAEFEEHTPEQVDAILAGADQTYRTAWSTVPFAERGRIVGRAGDLLQERRDSFARLATEEMGKRYSEALFEVDACVSILHYFAERAESILATRELEVAEGTSRIEARPLGVVFCIEPWNFPYIQLARVAAPIMMAGNTVVMKHSSSVPQCALAFEQLFFDAGAPVGLYTNVFLTADQSAAVIEDPRVQAVSLTGSERAGASVGAAAGRAMKRVTLELGGSDAFIVLADADLGLAVDLAVGSRMMNTGQACGGSKRFIAVGSVYDEFARRFADRLAALTPGDPLLDSTGVGPIVSKAALEQIEAQIADATSNGATIVTGGHRIDRSGFFIEPTLLADIAPDNPVYYQELFAPVGMLFRVDDDEEAVRVANDSPYGLGSSVVSRDLAHAERVGAEIESGMVFINHLPDTAPNQPWGGIKRSGYGRELSDLGIGEFVNWKLVRAG
ncbi:NAD-dependent succinate-semialdehyde dehydrogenase [Microbacterium sp. P05]|uniref:NAD-dependent succinate-semialdehyde dehydrogenase n=1 Tax=Microbacterium sp. P05 TaxID=3366948 RepID=UPI003747075E